MNKMNKSRWIVTFIAVGGVGVLMLASFFFWPKVNTTSARSALADQPMTVYFTAPVKPSVEASEFYVTDRNGKKISAELSYGSGRTSLKVEALQPGDYELHVPNNSFRGWKRTMDSTFSFAVIESVLPVGSIKEIETFFRQAPQINPQAALITGIICGIRVENIEDPTLQKIRWLDKLVDELAKGWPLTKIYRS